MLCACARVSACVLLGSARSSGQQDPQQPLLQRTSVSTHTYFLHNPRYFSIQTHVVCVFCVRSVFMELVKEESRHSLQENMRRITSPVQVIWGKEDEVTKPHSDTRLFFFFNDVQEEILKLKIHICAFACKVGKLSLNLIKIYFF